MKQLDFVSEEEYLDRELHSERKHEYLNGVVYAMAGANNRHNSIAGSIFGFLHFRLRGKPCMPCNSDTKVRFQEESDSRFYYPDVSVICESNPDGDAFQDKPVVIFEVLSDSTRRTDEEEKKRVYLQIESLETYILVEQNLIAAQVYQRKSDGEFERTVVTGDDGVIELPCIDVRLPLAEVYAE